MSASPKPVTTFALARMKRDGKKIVVLTAYDALFASLLDASGVDVVLVGDSVNTVLCGEDTTLSATLENEHLVERASELGARLRGRAGADPTGVFLVR